MFMIFSIGQIGLSLAKKWRHSLGSKVRRITAMFRVSKVLEFGGIRLGLTKEFIYGNPALPRFLENPNFFSTFSENTRKIQFL